MTPSRFADRVASQWPTLGWSALAVFGLLLALAATMNPADAPLAGSGPARLMIGLPFWLKATILGSLALAGLGLLLFLFFPLRRRRRRKGEEEFQIVHEVPKPSPWVAVVLVSIALAPIALAGSLLWWGWPDSETLGKPLPAAAAHGTVAQPAAPAPNPPAVTRPLFSGAVAVLGLAVTAACLGMLVWLLAGDRFIGGWVPPTPTNRIPPDLAEAVEESLDSLRQDPDARRAIIRCYRRFEGVLAGIGVPRAPWETPAEFMRKTLGQLPVPQEALRKLTGLFELSRFSRHPVGPTERDVALRSLMEIKGTVEQEDTHAPSA